MEDYFARGNPEGKSRREIMGQPIRSPEAFFSPEPRVKLMDELGVDRAVMWPTLASLLESGFPVLQSGLMGDARYTYFDTEAAIGAIMEIVHLGPGAIELMEQVKRGDF